MDKRSGVIVLEEPYVSLWQITLPFSSGFIVSRKAVEEAGGGFTTTVPASSGHYFIKEWVPQQRIVLARNPDWTGQVVDFDEIHLIGVPDAKAAEIAFEAGEVDFTAVSLSSVATR